MKRKIIDNINKSLCYLSALFCISIMVYLLYFIISNGIAHINLDLLLNDAHNGGISSMILGTLYIVVISILIATPIGIGSAIYLNEYSKDNRLTRTIRFAIDGLVSVPSIVYGLFGFSLFVVTLNFNYSILSGSLTLSVMILPIIIKTVEESLKSVPNDIKEGSLALGANKFQTIFKVILPSSITGILSSIILAIGRVISESAPLLLTAGMVTRIPNSIFDSSRTLTTHLYYLVSEGTSEEAVSQAFATAAILIIVILFLNIFTKVLVHFVNKKVG